MINQVVGYALTSRRFKDSEMPLEEERATLEAKVIELDDLIKAHLDCMADLTNRSVMVKRQLNAQVAFAHLPIEVVTIIFRLACSLEYEPLSPLRIGSICHHWRTIAWSASELWSSVTVSLEVSKEATKKQEDLLSAVIGYCGQGNNRYPSLSQFVKNKTHGGMIPQLTTRSSLCCLRTPNNGAPPISTFQAHCCTFCPTG